MQQLLGPNEEAESKKGKGDKGLGGKFGGTFLGRA